MENTQTTHQGSNSTSATKIPQAPRVLDHWPRNVSITFSGYDLGAKVFTGKDLENAPANSPILAAYQWYFGRWSTIREACDLITTLGVLGLDGFSRLGMKPMLAFANQ